MDPQATWTKLLDAYEAQAWPVVREAAESLLVWLAKGGFPPRLDNLHSKQVRLIVQMICTRALEAVPEDYEGM